MVRAGLLGVPDEERPHLPERLDDYEAPEGFADAVGRLQPMPAEQFPADVPAQELGGGVSVPPMDVPWVRLTVLRDPQGAGFTV